MASPGLLLLLLLTALPPLWSSSLPGLDTDESKATIADLILSALERATVFLEQRLPEINLDGMVGVRVLEEQLKSVQEKWAQEPLLQPLSPRMGTLGEKLEAAIQRSLHYLKLSDPKYLREFQLTLQPGFWKLPHAWIHTDASLVYPTFEPQDSFSEERSDACLVQLLGTGWALHLPCLLETQMHSFSAGPVPLLLLQAPRAEARGLCRHRTDSSEPCSLSDLCRSLMTKPGCSGYCLSHQLLFFLWARMRGCTQGPFQQSQDYISLFCANMMDLNRRAEAIGYAYPTRDIFMENIMFCGMGGFSDFYKLRWLEAILSWQKQREGCFGEPDAEDEELSKAIQYRQHFLRRVKRREKQFSVETGFHRVAHAGLELLISSDPPTSGSQSVGL
ncbi:UPF0764 protein C16orf89 homolog isoform X2 [Pongo pygmaeus]|uniref:UPF0764 protein C16orf89 homolog isoform X2 n=1 Tax=Pongo pygmaeus TaxID=9600 RepID=UPI00300CCAD3